jgi:hypothetical protein
MNFQGRHMVFRLYKIAMKTNAATKNSENLIGSIVGFGDEEDLMTETHGLIV